MRACVPVYRTRRQSGRQAIDYTIGAPLGRRGGAECAHIRWSASSRLRQWRGRIVCELCDDSGAEGLCGRGKRRPRGTPEILQTRSRSRFRYKCDDIGVFLSHLQVRGIMRTELFFSVHHQRQASPASIGLHSTYTADVQSESKPAMRVPIRTSERGWKRTSEADRISSIEAAH